MLVVALLPRTDQGHVLQCTQVIVVFCKLMVVSVTTGSNGDTLHDSVKQNET